jgi:PleD family two-component response regulator
MKILIIDNSPVIRNYLRNILLTLGYSEIVSAKDGLDALIKLSENKIDLIITERSLSVMNGFDLIKYLRLTDDYKKIPVVLLTKDLSKEDFWEAVNCGISNIIIKPFSFNIIRNKVCSLIPVEFEL